MNATTAKEISEIENTSRGGLVEEALTSPLGILAATLSALGLGLFALVIWTETLLLPTLFGVLMFAPVLSAIDHFLWHRKNHFTA